MSERPSPGRAALPVALLLVLACDSGSHPVAPGGTILTISANPDSISLHGTSTVEVTALDAVGGPIRTGTEIRLRTDLGEIDPVVRTDEHGIARATFVAGAAAGEATVTATSGVLPGESNPALNSVATTVTIAAGPEAAFSCTGSGLTVVFADDSSGDPASWEWSFGDGATSGERSPVHTYREAGSYQVRLVVRDGGGGESSVTRFAVVPGSGDVCAADRVPEAPEARFGCTSSGLTTIFSDASTGPPTRWRWDFGDGRGSSERDPVHTYAAPGTYVVTLEVGSSAGEDRTSQFVTVPDGGCS